MTRVSLVSPDHFMRTDGWAANNAMSLIEFQREAADLARRRGRAVFRQGAEQRERQP